jgi:HEPN domain-containing protein
MKPITLEWVNKAEGDYGKNPNYDGICFHAQQCAEKYLKAKLSEADIEFKKIQDLVALLDKVLVIEPSWEFFREHLAYLSDFAVNFRYPGESADKIIATDVRKRCRLFRAAARESFGLKTT